MKKLITTIALIFVASITNAQDDLTIKMAVKVEGLPAEYAAMGESEIVSYHKGEKSKREEINMMGSAVTYNDGNITTVLMEQMGEKTGWTATNKELDATSAKEKDINKPKIEYLTDKKTIAGYECTKAIITVVGKDKKETKITEWFTEKLKMHEPKNRPGFNLYFKDLKGRALEIEASVNQNGMDLKVLITTTEVSTAKLEDSVFKIDTTGYKMMTYKEVQDKMKAAEASGK